MKKEHKATMRLLLVWRVLTVILCIGSSAVFALIVSVVFEPIGSEYQTALISGTFIFMLLLTVISVQVFSNLVVNVSKLANNMDVAPRAKKKK